MTLCTKVIGASDSAIEYFHAALRSIGSRFEEAPLNQLRAMLDARGIPSARQFLERT